MKPPSHLRLQTQIFILANSVRELRKLAADCRKAENMELIGSAANKLEQAHELVIRAHGQVVEWSLKDKRKRNRR